MPARNAQNPIKAIGHTGRDGVKPSSGHGGHAGPGAPGHVRCPACGADAPLKPGFRPSSQKCPACGAALLKK
jgi:uncharacterized protein (DUF983 family)